MELDVCYSTIYNRIKKMKEKGITIPDYKKNKRDKIDNLILGMLKEGKNQSEIARELGVTRTAISTRIKIMMENEITIDKKDIEFLKRERIKNNEVNKTIIKGLEEGKNQSEIAHELNLTRQCISKKIKYMIRNGIDIQNEKTMQDKILSNLKSSDKVFEISKENYNNKKSSKVEELKEKDEKELANMIKKLKNTRNATDKQIKIIGDYYGVDVEGILSSLNEKEYENEK